MLSVKEESPRQAEVAALLHQSDTLAPVLYPGEYRRPLNPDTLDAPGVHLFVARADAGHAVGCCALFEASDGTGELKRMFVDTRFRKLGAGAALLHALEAAARLKGIHHIQMEVGIRNTDGQALYRRAGYQERGPFGKYRPSPISLFFEKCLLPPG